MTVRPPPAAHESNVEGTTTNPPHLEHNAPPHPHKTETPAKGHPIPAHVGAPAHQDSRIHGLNAITTAHGEHKAPPHPHETPAKAHPKPVLDGAPTHQESNIHGVNDTTTGHPGSPHVHILEVPAKGHPKPALVHNPPGGHHPIIKKGAVGFDPTIEAHNLENSNRKGHSKPEPHKERQQIDLSGEHGKRIFCQHLHSSLFPLCTLLRLAGRFPLSYAKSKDGKTYEYHTTCASMVVLHFNIITFLLVCSLFSGLFGVLKITIYATPSSSLTDDETDLNKSEIYRLQVAHDRALIERNAIPLIIVFTTLVQAILSSFLLTHRREYLAHIFSFINRAAYTLHMDLAERVRDFSVQSTVIFTIFSCTLIMLSSLKVGPTAVGTPLVFGSLMARNLLSLGHNRLWLNSENEKLILIIQILGGLFLVIIYTASIAPILLFIYKCKIVRNAFAFWNGRAYCALLRGMEFAQTVEARTTYNILFKDHCILLDLLDSIDQMYSFTLESFFALQVIGFFFQLYFFYRVGTQSQVSQTIGPILKHHYVTYLRPLDWIPALVLLLGITILLFSAGIAAAKVSEEAEAGMEVIRRKGVIGRRTDQELEFLHSISYSFQAYKKMEISGAGYLYYNKAFLMQLIAVSVFCFLLLVQYRPLFDYEISDTNSSRSIGRFLRKIEGASDHKNAWTNQQDDREWALGF